MSGELPPSSTQEPINHTLLLSPLSQQQQQNKTDSVIDIQKDTMSQKKKEVAAVLPGMTHSSQRKLRPPTVSLLGTWEFKTYYLIYLIVVSNMIYTMVRASSPQRPEYERYKEKLSEGWMLGRMVDLSDGQWDTFRSHLPAFTAALAAFVLLNKLVKYLTVSSSVLGRLWFSCLFASLFAIVLSGTSVIFILAITGGNYLLAKQLGGRGQWVPPVVFWIYNMTVLFANEYYQGYKFGKILGPSMAWLDGHRGVLRRWDITFNITMLRMISFAMDYHWRVRQEQEMQSPKAIDQLAISSTAKLTEKDRIERSCLRSDYCFTNYWSYLLYPPLYLTGPIITFNNFISQTRQPPPTITLRTCLLYGLRLLAAILLMELVLHTVYAVAISKWGHWETFSVYEISLFGYMRLTFIWLKLLIIWRFARFWAMADGLETVENMRRCMSNNYSLQQFWRDWHCSYNKWLIRYVYIPLGGRRTSAWNTFVVFTFVALWHDLTLRLLQWAWIIALLFLPEALATWVFNRPQWTTQPYFRYICSMGGALNIIAMMIANLVGFGDDGVDEMLGKIFSQQGAVFLLTTYFLFNIHLQVTFEWREHEYRKEYHRKTEEAEPIEMATKKN